MHPRHRIAPTLIVISAFLVLAVDWVNQTSHAQGQQVQVTAADPAAAEQGTINLNVKVTGKGFKTGAHAQWFVTGTTNPGGVTVNSTTFVSSTELNANITVADAATIANFDIQVLNSDGRGGKGSELFAVTQKGGSPNLCTVQPLPAGISLVNSLNYVTGSGAAAYGPALGTTVRARQMTLNGVQVLVVAAGTPAATGKLEIFLINPVTGQLLDNTIIGSGTVVQPHITINNGSGNRSLAVGDVNGDGIPDFAAGSTTTGSANGIVGSIANGVLGYQSYALVPSGTISVSGWGVAVGDLSGTGSDVIALYTVLSSVGQVSLFSFNGSGFTNTQNISSPMGSKKNVDDFGHGITIANVTGSTAKDLIVGAPGSTVNGSSAAGVTYIFPGPVTQSNYLTLTTGVKSDWLGQKVAAGTVNADTINDVLATTNSAARIYYGLVSNGQASSLLLSPASGLGGGWGTTEPDVNDINGDALADILIGAPNAGSGSTCGGVAYLYLSSLGSPAASRLMLSTPVQDSQSSYVFGWSVAFASGTRLFLIGDHGANVGSTSPGGQVYVYKLN